MATIQSRVSRGQKYWYIVESRRVNGKPRPVMLAYLGKADNLLKRLKGLTNTIKLKSYSHGSVAALLKIAYELDVCTIINKHIKSSRRYVSKKPIRNNLTAGVTYLLAAIGRVCMPTSKRGWWTWAKTTSLEYLLRCNFNKINSQHFWDLMDALPIDKIEKIEEELLKNIFKVYKLESDSLFFDTTNFFTYIHTTNEHCGIAQRGKNKQKRHDLRQVGLAMVVTKKDMIPLFHLTYRGNKHDSKIFNEIVTRIKTRMETLQLNIEEHTLIFDRGNNSKVNLELINKNQLHYVGALTPYHHKDLVDDATNNFQELNIDDNKMQVYRDKRMIWGEERTVVVCISKQLKAGQIRGIYQSLRKIENELLELQKRLSNPKAKKQEKEGLEKKVTQLTKGHHFINGFIKWEIKEVGDKKFQLLFSIDDSKLNEIENRLGFRILMTDRHDWSIVEIIKAYQGQARIEYAFKNLKNPYHLAIKPQFHWTDQKIIVHYFICVLGYLLSALIYREIRLKCQFRGSLSNLFSILDNIRLATLLEEVKTSGKLKAIYKLEEMDKQEQKFLDALAIDNFHTTRPKFSNVGVYT